MANDVASLDLYARIEAMLHNEEAVDNLYGLYYRILNTTSFTSLLDIGCGGGAFLQGLLQRFGDIDVLGVDLSGEMVRRTQARGIRAKAMDVCDLTETFDVATAVFDMFNYLPSDALTSFFACVEARLNPGGTFIFDINTRFGFEHVATGAYIVDEAERFLAVDSDFEHDKYMADFTLFTQQNGCYTRESQRITQYYHPLKRIKKTTSMQLINAIDIELYGLGEADKTLLIFQKK